MRFPLKTLLALWLSASLGGCKSQEKEIKEAFIKASVLSEPPANLDQAVNRTFAETLTYLGNQVDTALVNPGGSGRIFHYWKVLQDVPAGWKIETRLEGDSNQSSQFDESELRKVYPMKSWKAGTIIRDEQVFQIDKSWLSAQATMKVTLRDGETNLPLPATEPSSAQALHLPVFTFQVQLDAAKSDGEYVVRKSESALVIDGYADEAVWKKVAKGPAFVAAKGGAPNSLDTYARMLWDDDYLYVFIQAADTDVFSSQTEHDGPLWKEDVVEVFIDADRNRHGYVELQVNPNNAQLDAWFPKTRAQKHDFTWSANMKSAVVVHGSLESREDRDRGWDVEMAIPLAAVKGRDEAMRVNLPPSPGDSWRINVVRVETSKAGALSASSWSQIPIQDFHALNHMFTIVFADEAGQVRPKVQLDPGSLSFLHCCEY